MAREVLKGTAILIGLILLVGLIGNMEYADAVAGAIG